MIVSAKGWLFRYGQYIMTKLHKVSKDTEISYDLLNVCLWARLSFHLRCELNMLVVLELTNH